MLRAIPTRNRRLAILLTRDSEMRSLNRRFLGEDRPTDVLSFPLSVAVPMEKGYLGDIAISVEMAARQARSAGWRIRDEVRLLILHGLLHLLGYDHETDRGEMEQIQAELSRRVLGRSATLAERPSSPRDGARSLPNRTSR